MSAFLTGNELSEKIYDIIWEAESQLLIVSPYIKLDAYFKNLFIKHKSNPKIQITIVFGKNEEKINKSLCKEDFDFFKQFANISIVYVPNLHAKYYGNEKEGMITSINLYDYSFKNNIEFGIYSRQSVLNPITDKFIGNPDEAAWDTCINIAKDNDAIFIKRPVYIDKKFIVSYGRDYIESQTLLDYTEHFYGRKSSNYTSRRIDEFPDEIDHEEANKQRPVRTEEENNNTYQKRNTYQKQEYPQYGYCIRTGEQIKFNPAQPLSYNAWKSWDQFGNMDYPEKYCHKTGNKSYGRTSFRNPILE